LGIGIGIGLEVSEWGGECFVLERMGFIFECGKGEWLDFDGDLDRMSWGLAGFGLIGVEELGHGLESAPFAEVIGIAGDLGEAFERGIGLLDGLVDLEFGEFVGDGLFEEGFAVMLDGGRAGMLGEEFSLIEEAPGDVEGESACSVIGIGAGVVTGAEDAWEAAPAGEAELFGGAHAGFHLGRRREGPRTAGNRGEHIQNNRVKRR
jgi:hypothetical protein